MPTRTRQPVAVPAVCGAVEDVTGHACRRTACDGAHPWDGDAPWRPASRDLQSTTPKEALR